MALQGQLAPREEPQRRVYPAGQEERSLQLQEGTSQASSESEQVPEHSYAQSLPASEPLVVYLKLPAGLLVHAVHTPEEGPPQPCRYWPTGQLSGQAAQPQPLPSSSLQLPVRYCPAGHVALLHTRHAVRPGFT